MAEERVRGYGAGGVDAVISVDEVERQAAAIAEEIPIEKLAALAGNESYVTINDLHAGYGKMEIIHGLEAELDRISAALPGDPQLMDAAWLIQELRVSLFAQSIGTKGKVSVKRVRQLLYDIEMG